MRDIPVGNGSLLINFDDKYQIRDVYFPHVGQENHTEGFPFRFGVWAAGAFSWVFEDGWERTLRYLPDTLVTDVTLVNRELGLEITCNDTVASHENVFLRRVRVRDTSGRSRDVRVFLHHDLRIYENKVGDTAYYDAETSAIVHYKKHRYFLINSDPHFSSFATGRKAFRDKEGTWRDAEDGELHNGAMTEGSVDSTIGVHFQLHSRGEYTFYYWIAAGLSGAEVSALNDLVIERRPGRYIEQTQAFWRAWVNKNDTDLSALPPKFAELYKRSLLIVRTQIDNGGAILAANDADVRERATDHYSYLWPRDGAFVANALDRAGYPHMPGKFYELCEKLVHRNGYFLQKYNADGTVASGWHAEWDPYRRKKLVPIQEDETALVLWAYWEHYKRYRDIEFAYRLYRPLIVHCADFLVSFRDPHTRLPMPSWNLWEDRRGVHTYTCCTVAAGLRAAAEFAELFCDVERAEIYRRAADEVLAATEEHLYSRELGRFLRSLQFHDDDTFEADATVDASLFATFYLGCFAPDDPMVEGTMRAVEKYLSAGGGIARFQNDGYMRVNNDHPGNAWIICTLWLAEYYIARALRKEDLEKARELMAWVAEHAAPSGVMSEQIDPAGGSQVSVSPLTWSHSTFIATALEYKRKLESFGPTD